MTPPKIISNFSSQFTDMAESFAKNAELVFEVECPSKKAAQHLRFKFYTYRKTARVSGEIDEFPILNAIEVHISPLSIKTGNHLATFRCVDYSPMAISINDALLKAGVVPTIDIEKK